MKFLGPVVLIVLGILVLSGVLDVFPSYILLEGVRFSPSSAPYNFRLNIDKIIFGYICLFWFLRHKPRNPSFSSDDRLKDVGRILIILCLQFLVLFPIAVSTRYVQWDPKWSEHAPMWLLVNLFCTVVAEEAIFRGFVQTSLQKLLKNSALLLAQIVPILGAGVLFGLDHYRGGLIYMGMATVAGLFYGAAFGRRQNLLASIFVHFSFNCIHYFLFSYPFLDRASR